MAAERERLVRDLTKAQMRQEFVLRAARVVALRRPPTPPPWTDWPPSAVPVLGDLCIIDVVGDDGGFERMACHHRDPSKADLVQELRERYPPTLTGAIRPPTSSPRAGPDWSGAMTDSFLRATCRDDRHYEIVKDARLRVLHGGAADGQRAGAGDGDLGVGRVGSALRSRGPRLGRAVAVQVVLGARPARRGTSRRPRVPYAAAQPAARLVAGVEGVELAARYLPATTYAEVGGDWYDAVADGDRLCLVIGDVEGHDLHAATMMANLRHGLCLLLAEGIWPTEALDRLNRFSIRSNLDRLATLLIADLDLVHGTMAVATAGHFPPVVRTYGGTRLIEVPPSPPSGSTTGVGRSR